jgi:hypothetical protein
MYGPPLSGPPTHRDRLRLSCQSLNPKLAWCGYLSGWCRSTGDAGRLGSFIQPPARSRLVTYDHKEEIGFVLARFLCGRSRKGRKGPHPVRRRPRRWVLLDASRSRRAAANSSEAVTRHLQNCVCCHGARELAVQLGRPDGRAILTTDLEQRTSRITEFMFPA